MYQIQSHPTPVSITDQSDNSILTASRLLQYSNAYSQYLSLLEDQNINLKQYHEIYIYISFSEKQNYCKKSKNMLEITNLYLDMPYFYDSPNKVRFKT